MPFVGYIGGNITLCCSVMRCPEKLIEEKCVYVISGMPFFLFCRMQRQSKSVIQWSKMQGLYPLYCYLVMRNIYGLHFFKLLA